MQSEMTKINREKGNKEEKLMMSEKDSKEESLELDKEDVNEDI